MSQRQLARSIDYTNLNLDATEDDIRQLCAEALQHSFASVCVRPVWVALAADLLRGSVVKVCTVIGFHEGTYALADKIAEAERAIADGAQEIDWVVDFRAMDNALVCGDVETPMAEIHAIAQIARAFVNVVVKVIIECCAITDDTKRWITEQLARMGVIHFVKTSTGMGMPRAPGVPKGATVDDVWVLRRVITACGSDMQVKASGGITSRAAAIGFLQAGATRLGIGRAGALAVIAQGDGPSADVY